MADDDVAQEEAVEAFERLGLTGYQAKVFIALHRLGSGTARDVSRATDVPRSQVYSAAEALADRGLVGVQQSSPMRYRPVSLEAARSTLRERFERETERAFEYVDGVRGENGGERREDIWILRGRDAVSDRIAELVGEADRRVVFGAGDPDLVPDVIAESLRSRAAAGLSVTVVTESEAVADRFGDDPGIEVVEPPPKSAENDRVGRLLYADRDAILLSVLGTGPGEDETAVWSTDSNFAEVLVQLVEASVGVTGG